ncbi:hypothetical protein GY45DRAFT_1210940, partial [Cubamyces sp. BRFM 1775]
AARLSPSNFDLLAFQRRGPCGRGCGWAGWDAPVSVHIRFYGSSSESSLSVEKAAWTCRRGRSY